jgi:RNA ligase (TIGR02306 family)
VSWWKQALNWFGVIKLKPWEPDNNFAKMALQVKDKLQEVEDYAFQGELMGPGIQGNREGFDKLRWFIYDVVDISTRSYLSPEERRTLCAELGLEHAPVLVVSATYPESVESALDYADKLPSINHKVAEGVVYKSNKDPSLSFKAIANRYLLNEKE